MQRIVLGMEIPGTNRQLWNRLKENTNKMAHSRFNAYSFGYKLIRKKVRSQR